MIAKVVRGWRPGGLLAYLFGPGRFEEHHNPRVVASWDGAPFLHQPDPLPAVELDGRVLAPGEFDLDLRPLIATLTGPARAAGLPTSTPPARAPTAHGSTGPGRPPPSQSRWYKRDPHTGQLVLRPGYVWHCPVRLHPDDPTLTDAQWQHVAHRLMHATGIHQAGCRWIAVRHADDHIHLVATLVSETTGHHFHPYRDYPKLRTECQRLERELGLVATPAIDRTATPTPTRAELGKAARLGRHTTPRQELHRVVSRCAATTRNEHEFFDALQELGLDPQPVRSPHGQLRGYTVSLPGDRSADGHRLRFAGSSLAPDLTWPTLHARWATTPPPNPTPAEPAPTAGGRAAGRRATLRAATAVTQRAAVVVQTRGEDGDAIAHATGELLTVLAAVHDGPHPGPLTQLAHRYQRAGRQPFTVVSSTAGPVAQELRRAARRVAASGRLTGGGNERLATVALLLALGSLVAEIAAWHHTLSRPHHTAAAHATARALPALADPTLPTRPRRTPTPAATPPPHPPTNDPNAQLDAWTPAHRPAHHGHGGQGHGRTGRR